MRKLLLFVFISFTIANFAQVPRWILHPTYDKISILGNGYYVVSQNHQFGMLNAEEKEVVPLKYDSISPFKSHQGLLYNNNKFVGYVSDNGVVQDLSAGQYQVVGDQGFSDGYLSVHNNTGYYYIRVSDGVENNLGMIAGIFSVLIDNGDCFSSRTNRAGKVCVACPIAITQATRLFYFSECT